MQIGEWARERGRSARGKKLSKGKGLYDRRELVKRLPIRLGFHIVRAHTQVRKTDFPVRGPARGTHPTGVETDAIAYSGMLNSISSPIVAILI